jgi:hypothetical protein
MRARFGLLLAAVGALPLSAQDAAEAIPVPSGQPVTFVELVTDAEGIAGDTWRFRFLAPQIAREGGSVGLDAALADIDAICAQFIAPLLTDRGVALGQVIISLADRPVPFGETVPEATQYFEAYRLEGGQCVWEGF